MKSFLTSVLCGAGLGYIYLGIARGPYILVVVGVLIAIFAIHMEFDLGGKIKAWWTKS